MESSDEWLDDADVEIPKPFAPLVNLTNPMAEARFEHEAGVLDLSEAAQAVARARTLADRGDVVESQRLAEVARQLYESADRRRERAQRLDPGRRFV